MNVYVDVHEDVPDDDAGYYQGWLARFYGLPMAPPARKGLPPYKSECVEKFRRGWLACQDVPPADRYAAMLKLLLEGKVVSYWCDVGGVEVTRFSGEG